MPEKKDNDNNECFAGEQGITCGCKECDSDKKLVRNYDYATEFDKYMEKCREILKEKEKEKNIDKSCGAVSSFGEETQIPWWVKPLAYTSCEYKSTLKSNKYSEKAAAVSKLVEEKQAAYGDSFSNSGDILRKLFPDGIMPDKYDDLLAITRIVDKLFRIANQKDAFGESPYDDIIGYALLGATSGRGEKK